MLLRFLLSSAFIMLSWEAVASHGHDGEVLPPPPVLKPEPQEESILKCTVHQYNLECHTSHHGERVCDVGPSVSESPVIVKFLQSQDDRITIKAKVRGQEKIVYESTKRMKCDLPSYKCSSRDGQEKVAIVQARSSQYGTLDFTVWEQAPVSRYAYSIGATAEIKCWIP